MRILITTDWYAPVINGVVTSVLNLETALRSKGHDVRILTLSQNVHGEKQENVYRVPSFSIGKIYPSARFICNVRRDYINEILDWKPEIIHSQCEFSSYILARKIARRLDIPIVHTYHTVYEDYTHYFAPREAWGRSMVKCFSRQLLARTERVIVPTEKVKRMLEGYGIRRPIDVIPTGIDLDKFRTRYSREELEAKRAELGIPLTDKVLVYVGRMAKEKNVEEIIDYFERADAAGVSLLLVGGGPSMESLRQKAAGTKVSSRIFFTGMVQPEQVPMYYQMGQVFVCASNSETQGITYGEALASGCVPLCKKDPCIDNLVVNDLTGFQYEGYDSFKNALDRMLTDGEFREQLAANGRRISENMGTELFVKRIIASYEQALYGRTGRLARYVIPMRGGANEIIRQTIAK